MNIQIISDRPIRHRACTQGIVVTREQVIEIDGVRHIARYWSDWQTGALHHVDSTPAEVFEPMRNARGEIVEPVFGGSAPYSDESREADRASAGYRKLHGGEGW